MKCNDIQELIKTDYVDGELSDSLAKEVKTHIMACESCAKLEARLLKLQQPFKQTELMEPPKKLWSAIESEITREKAADTSLPQSGIGRILSDALNALRLNKPALASLTIILLFVISISGQNILSNRADMQMGAHMVEMTQFYANGSELFEDDSMGAAAEIFFL